MADFDFSAYKVLMCDTDPEAIDVARTTYLDENIKDFVATPSPEEALNQVVEMKPDLILIAMDLPDTNGIEVIQKIRSLNDGEFYKTPILMLLDKVSQNLLREACRAGIEGALRKPIVAGKVIRFSRAVIQKPRRFICVRHYFGPERRMRDDPHFNGDDRRSSFTREELSTDEFTHSRPISKPTSDDLAYHAPRGVTLSAGSPIKSNPQNADWGQSQSRPKADGGVMDFGTGSTDASAKGNYDVGSTMDLMGSGANQRIETAGSSASNTASSGNFDFGTSEQSAASSGSSNFDYGSSETKATFDNSKIDFSSEEIKKDEVKDIAPPAIEEPKEKPTSLEATGPDSEDFEEIIDLEECLELHKTWINSGGKLGLQANRPHSDFRGQELAEADFTKAVLPQSNFEGVNCKDTVFRKADLNGSTFKGALLFSADLRVTRLSKADLRNARLDRANLLGADLTGANLEGAVLRGVNLNGANLNRTNLRGVNLTTVQGLIPEQIKRAITDNTTRLPLNVLSAS